MPLLFAVTLFVSASLLFMVQPMVGKLVLPLLGGSPAVWNACMVFFQALLLLGYLYADRLTRLQDARKQWVIHIGVMMAPIAVFLLSVLLGPRGTPIAAAEALAPTGGSSAILSILAILTVAIGVPFFVVSTSATLLQKWFTYTGHPSARDPYFLYSASNAGSLISLLGYPLFIEPNMTQGNQTWFWAVGFLGLFALITFCGRAAANPLGVPPGASLAPATGGGAKYTGKQGGASQNKPGTTGANKQAAGPNDKPLLTTPPAEPPPSWLRMAKWTALAFVPSSLMLGVTFHMTTDIASIPLLWVGPLALYLITFIIAFGKTPPWTRVLIGNLAPVMILLLVFLMISEVKPGVGLELLLYNLTFFAAALMCHYELARDRPSPQYLTTYFLIMSLGGVLGGIFNSLVAPMVFSLAYEFPLALIVACLMVPRLSFGDGVESVKPSATQSKPQGLWLWGWLGEDDLVPETVGAILTLLFGLITLLPVYSAYIGVLSSLGGIVLFTLAYLFVWRPLRQAYLKLQPDTQDHVALALDIVLPVLVGLAFWQLRQLPTNWDWYSKWMTGLSQSFPNLNFLSVKTIYIVMTYALPVMICFFFVDRPLRFALAVAAILGQSTINKESEGTIYNERSFFGILKIEENPHPQYLLDRTQFFKLNEKAFNELQDAKLPEPVLQKLTPLKDATRMLDLSMRLMTGGPFEMKKAEFQDQLARILTPEENAQYQELILKHAHYRTNPGDTVVKDANGKSIVVGKYEYRRLVHGTTLHGTQAVKHDRHILDDFQLLTAAHPWENIAVMGAIQTFDMKQEPLTYYHRTGPVGAMFGELKRQGKDKAPVAMVGLGTGSVSCYAEKGQKLTFYEIDPAVKKLVADTDKYFTFVEDARRRGAEVDFRMGDARLMLKHDTDRKYQLLLVDAFSSDSIPVHLLTNEAVQLYLDRLTEDGILALHISNKFVKLEPVVAAIAQHHNLVARVWNDDAEGRHGKTASSWVVLARKREHLGDRLCSPIGDLMMFDTRKGPLPFPDTTILELLERDYPDFKSALAKATGKQHEAILAFLDQRANDPQAQVFARWIRKYGSEHTKLNQILATETGYGFRPLRPMQGLEAWTDDYADVMRVMMIPELQAVRRFAGLPTLDDE